MKVAYCVQGTDTWWTLRRGIPTSSEFSRILTAKTMKLSAGAEGYIAQLCADVACLTPNYFSEHGVSRPMQNGHDTEPEARRYYCMERNCDVQEVGFCLADDGRAGASPDGLVGVDGLLELKCPNRSTQTAYLLADELPAEYKAQCHGQLIVTGRKWVDFCSYAPGLPPFITRVEPSEYTDALREALDVFHGKYQAAIDKLGLRERYDLIRAEQEAMYGGRQVGGEAISLDPGTSCRE